MGAAAAAVLLLGSGAGAAQADPGTAGAPRVDPSAAATAPRVDPDAAALRYERSVAAYEIPAVTLVASDGAAVPLAAELAREGPVVVQLVFTTCPTVCPVLSGTLAALGRRRPGLRLLSISIDPGNDTPERLREHAARLGAGKGWRFLTGSAADLLAVQRAFDAYRGDKMRHQPLTFLRAAPGAPWVRLTGFPTAAEIDAELAAAPRPPRGREELAGRAGG